MGKVVASTAFVVFVFVSVLGGQTHVIRPESRQSLGGHSAIETTDPGMVQQVSKLLAERAQPSAQRIGPLSCTVAPTLSCNTTMNGNPSCLSGEYYIDLWTFNALAGQTLTITATTATGYQQLVTIQSNGSILKQSNGPSPVTVTYTFTTAGAYYIGFGFVAKFATGAYTLALTCGTPTLPTTCQTAGTLTRNVQVSGAIGPADAACSVAKTTYFKRYEFTATAGIPIRIVVSTSFPKYLEAASVNASSRLTQRSEPAEPYLIFYPLTSGQQFVWIGQDVATPTSGTFTITIEDEPLDPCRRRAVSH
jgi:hypothetical protein